MAGMQVAPGNLVDTYKGQFHSIRSFSQQGVVTQLSEIKANMDRSIQELSQQVLDRKNTKHQLLSPQKKCLFNGVATFFFAGGTVACLFLTDNPVARLAALVVGTIATSISAIKECCCGYVNYQAECDELPVLEGQLSQLRMFALFLGYFNGTLAAPRSTQAPYLEQSIRAYQNITTDEDPALGRMVSLYAARAPELIEPLNEIEGFLRTSPSLHESSPRRDSLPPVGHFADGVLESPSLGSGERAGLEDRRITQVEQLRLFNDCCQRIRAKFNLREPVKELQLPSGRILKEAEGRLALCSNNAEDEMGDGMSISRSGIQLDRLGATTPTQIG